MRTAVPRGLADGAPVIITTAVVVDLGVQQLISLGPRSHDRAGAGVSLFSALSSSPD